MTRTRQAQAYTMSQPLPHFATISYTFCHRFNAEVIEGVFRWVLEEDFRAGYLSPEVVFVDGTHIKANANMNHEREILHYFHDRLTNAVCEGINSMIQAAKRKARGFNTFDGFAAMIYLVAGKLELAVPDPF